MYVPLVTYSVHLPPFGNLFCTYGSFWRLFCTYTSPCLAYSLQVPRLHSYSYTSDFCGLFCILLLKTYHDSAHTSGDLFCTRALSWWPILYKGNIFVHHLFLWAILYIYFSLVSLSLLGKYFMTTCTPFWLPILYTHTYHEDLYSCDFHGLFHLFLPGVLIFTYFMVTLWWPILNIYFYLGDLFCTYGCFARLILYSYFPML